MESTMTPVDPVLEIPDRCAASNGSGITRPTALPVRRLIGLGILRSAQADGTDNGREHTDHSRRAAGVYAPKLKQMTSGPDGRGVAAVGRYGCHCARLRPPLAARGWVWQKIFRCTHPGRTFHVPAPEFPWVPLWSFSRSSYPTGLRKQSPLAMRYRPRSVSALAGVATWIVSQIFCPRG